MFFPRRRFRTPLVKMSVLARLLHRHCVSHKHALCSPHSRSCPALPEPCRRRAAPQPPGWWRNAPTFPKWPRGREGSCFFWCWGELWRKGGGPGDESFGDASTGAVVLALAQPGLGFGLESPFYWLTLCYYTFREGVELLGGGVGLCVCVWGGGVLTGPARRIGSPQH